MKKQILTATALSICCLLLFTGCLKDNCKHSYKIQVPVYKKLRDLRAAVQGGAATPLSGASKIYITGNRIYLSEKDKGVHVIDNSNPASPRNTAFINIPGNGDVVVRGNTLYADLYCDLAAVDISDPQNISVKKYITNAFPYRLGYATYTTNPDSISVLVDWISKDTIVSCEEANTWRNCPNCNVFLASSSGVQSAAGGDSKAAGGTGGSMARFAAVDNYMYAVGRNDMSIIDLASVNNPTIVKRQNVGNELETIFPFKDNLFLGSATGMFVYNISDPVNPKAVSWQGHWRMCDPVIADDNYAYVTLFDAAICGSANLNQMEVYSISNINKPTLVKTYPLTNPHGLAKDGNLLFICDGRDGLKIFDATKADDIKLLKHLPGTESYDVIALNGIAYVSTKSGLYQYDYSNIGNVRLLSKLEWKNN